MTPRLFNGFPRGTRFTPVPDALLGPLLAEIDDAAELKLTLRAVHLLHAKRGYPRYLTVQDLLSDPALVAAFREATDGVRQAVQAALAKAAARRTLLRVPLAAGGEAYVLNNDEGRRTAHAIAGVAAASSGDPVAEPVPPRESIFSLYEENIGPLTPLIAEELKEAETTYPWSNIVDAFREAVEHNKRSWRYVQRILERWAAEGRGEHGEPGRHPEAIDRKEYLRRYSRLTRP